MADSPNDKQGLSPRQSTLLAVLPVITGILFTTIIAQYFSVTKSLNDHDTKFARFEEWRAVQKFQDEESRKRMEAFEKNLSDLTLAFRVFQADISRTIESTKRSVDETAMQTKDIRSHIQEQQKDFADISQKLGNIYNILDNKPVIDVIKSSK